MKKLPLLMILSLLILLVSAGCRRQAFSGNETANEKQWSLEYTDLNATKTHDIKLEEGASIDVAIEDKSGDLDIFISDTNGEKIYKGDNASSGKFSIKVPKTDTYKFSVTGKNAKGSVKFRIAIK